MGWWCSLVNTSPCHGEDRGFKSLPARINLVRGRERISRVQTCLPTGRSLPARKNITIYFFMTLRSYLIGMLICSLLCLGSWILILIYVDPTTAGLLEFALFYLSLFFGLAGTFTLIGFYFRRLFAKNEIVFAHIGVSFRQGIFLAIILAGSLLLQNLGIFIWWTALLFIASITLLEFYFMTR